MEIKHCAVRFTPFELRSLRKNPLESLLEGHQLWTDSDKDKRAALERFAHHFLVKARKRGREGAPTRHPFVLPLDLILEAAHMSPYRFTAHGLRMWAAMTLYKEGAKLRAQDDPNSFVWHTVTVGLDACDQIAFAVPDLQLKDYLRAANAYWSALPHAAQLEHLDAYQAPLRGSVRTGAAQLKATRHEWNSAVLLGKGNRSQGARFLLSVFAKALVA